MHRRRSVELGWLLVLILVEWVDRLHVCVPAIRLVMVHRRPNIHRNRTCIIMSSEIHRVSFGCLPSRLGRWPGPSVLIHVPIFGFRLQLQKSSIIFKWSETYIVLSHHVLGDMGEDLGRDRWFVTAAALCRGKPSMLLLVFGKFSWNSLDSWNFTLSSFNS